MQSSLPKVLHPVAGQSLLAHVLGAAPTGADARLAVVIGPDHKYLLPATALLGASFLLLADCISRVIVAPAELPIGIVTAAFGGPFFLWILLRRRAAFAW